MYDVKNDVVLCHFTIIGSIEQAKYTMVLQCSTGQNSTGECSEKLWMLIDLNFGLFTSLKLKYLSNNVQSHNGLLLCKSGLLGNFSEVVSCDGSLYTFAAGASSSRILTSTKQQE